MIFEDVSYNKSKQSYSIVDLKYIDAAFGVMIWLQSYDGFPPSPLKSFAMRSFFGSPNKNFENDLEYIQNGS